MICYFPVTCVLVHAHIDSPALGVTTPDKRPPSGQPIFNIQWARVLSSPVPEENAPRRLGIIRTSNMNPRNIGPYIEGEGEEDGKEKGYGPSVKGQKEEGAGCRRKKGFN